jgi:hypothetical protein
MYGYRIKDSKMYGYRIKDSEMYGYRIKDSKIYGYRIKDNSEARVNLRFGESEINFHGKKITPIILGLLHA